MHFITLEEELAQYNKNSIFYNHPNPGFGNNTLLGPRTIYTNTYKADLRKFIIDNKITGTDVFTKNEAEVYKLAETTRFQTTLDFNVLTENFFSIDVTEPLEMKSLSLDMWVNLAYTTTGSVNNTQKMNNITFLRQMPYVMMNLFSSIEVQLNGKIISPDINYYQSKLWISYLSSLVLNNAEYEKKGILGLDFSNHLSQMNIFINPTLLGLLPTKANIYYNNSYLMQNLPFVDNKRHISIPLYFLIPAFNNDGCIPSGTNLTFRFKMINPIVTNSKPLLDYKDTVSNVTCNIIVTPCTEKLVHLTYIQKYYNQTIRDYLNKIGSSFTYNEWKSENVNLIYYGWNRSASESTDGFIPNITYRMPWNKPLPSLFHLIPVFNFTKINDIGITSSGDLVWKDYDSNLIDRPRIYYPIDYEFLLFRLTCNGSQIYNYDCGELLSTRFNSNSNTDNTSGVIGLSNPLDNCEKNYSNLNCVNLRKNYARKGLGTTFKFTNDINKVTNVFSSDLSFEINLSATTYVQTGSDYSGAAGNDAYLLIIYPEPVTVNLERETNKLSIERYPILNATNKRKNINDDILLKQNSISINDQIKFRKINYNDETNITPKTS